MVHAKHDEMIGLHEEGIRLLRKTAALIRDTERLLEETRVLLDITRRLSETDAMLSDALDEPDPAPPHSSLRTRLLKDAVCLVSHVIQVGLR